MQWRWQVVGSHDGFPVMEQHGSLERLPGVGEVLDLLHPGTPAEEGDAGCGLQKNGVVIQRPGDRRVARIRLGQ